MGDGLLQRLGLPERLYLDVSRIGDEGSTNAEMGAAWNCANYFARGDEVPESFRDDDVVKKAAIFTSSAREVAVGGADYF